MTTIFLLIILVLIIIWTAMTYLDKSFTAKYKTIFEFICFVIIEPSLFLLDVPLIVCGILTLMSFAICIYYGFRPSSKIPILTLNIFAHNYIFWATPYAISKLFNTSMEKSDAVWTIIGCSSTICIAIIYFLISKKNKKQFVKYISSFLENF